MRAAASAALRSAITSLTSTLEMNFSGSCAPLAALVTRKPTESKGPLFAMASPLFTRRAAGEYPLPFGRYRGETIAAVASRTLGTDYLEDMARETEVDHVAEMICLYLGYCPLAVRPTATNEVDETDNF